MAELAIINGYDIRDRKLADATTKTGVDSSDSIVLKTTSGYANILKEDFTKAVRSVMGGLLSDLDKGTSIDSVACLGSGNHDFGSISTANLASVLGVPRGLSIIELSSNDENNPWKNNNVALVLDVYSNKYERFQIASRMKSTPNVGVTPEFKARHKYSYDPWSEWINLS